MFQSLRLLGLGEDLDQGGDNRLHQTILRDGQVRHDFGGQEEGQADGGNGFHIE